MAEVEVMETANDALRLIMGEKIDVLVFISRGMMTKARKIKKEYPKLKIVLFTGLIPDEEIILVSKGWLLGVKETQRIILFS